VELLNGEIFVGYEALGELSKKDLPVKISFGLAKLKIALGPLYEAIAIIRTDLIKKYGEEDKETPGNFGIKPNSPNMLKFQDDIIPLMMEKVEVAVDKVVLPLEVDGKPFNVSADVLASLDKLIEIEG